ncbi:hypothetical protein KPSA1_01467 [Pseudomonas syringae pv. actinidiae]|uniref:Uncharacterized protein n=1 Tax=Pseudomonas syringae pv. actinidiae TaxID=103796 RepID=A0A2V0Q5X5_PSESF|nr:hypothetical protein KPSA1_01467 [Pseudomonas syringae pv. actinidiae]
MKASLPRRCDALITLRRLNHCRSGCLNPAARRMSDA